jgi:hypothetical protein
MTDFLGVDVSGVDEIAAKIKKLPGVVQDYVVDDLSKYYINVFKTSQPPQKFVTRAQAYPNAVIRSPRGKRIVGFFSWAQFKFVMALWSQGKVPHRRTQAMRNAWRQVGEGERSFIVNDAPGAQFVMGDETQSRHEKLVGWQTVGVMISSHMPQAMKKVDAAIVKAFRKLGLKT